MSEDEIKAVEDEVQSQMDAAVEAALAADYPDPAEDAATEYSR